MYLNIVYLGCSWFIVSDLFRRVCDKQEKDFLRNKGVVSETQSDLGTYIYSLSFLIKILLKYKMCSLYNEGGWFYLSVP